MYSSFYKLMGVFAVSILSFVSNGAKAQSVTTVDLYQHVAPYNKQQMVLQETASRAADDVLRISYVVNPTLTIYKPLVANGTAVVICPGGGYSILAWEKEGVKVAELLSSWGITACILKYRLPNDTLMNNKSFVPLLDAQKAMQYLRSHAAALNIQLNKIGIMGFSAGGHLAATASTKIQPIDSMYLSKTISVQPNFSILIYPVISFTDSLAHRGSMAKLLGNNFTEQMVNYFSNELQVTTATPPTFLVHAGNDASVKVSNSIQYYKACLENKVLVEMHLYPVGGHGFGLNDKIVKDKWWERLRNWLLNLQML